MKTRVSNWRRDPEGNEYRIHFDTQTNEYRKVDTKLDYSGLIPFIVTVRNRDIYHVKARNEETAAKPFYSGDDNKLGLPTRSEVLVRREE